MRRLLPYIAMLFAGLTTSLAFSPSAFGRLIQEDLYFGRNIPGGGEVSESQFQTFVDGVITPRFPAGMTAFNANGQFRDNTGATIQERSKVVTLFVDDTAAPQPSIDAIAAAYRQQFRQESVLQVGNREDLRVSFGEGDLFANSSTPKLIQTDLYFGRNISGGGQVSESQFQTFVDSVITPNFPAGLTILDAQGQFQDSTGAVIKEPSKLVTLVLDDTLTNENSVNQIIRQYIQQFNQESVLVGANEAVTVNFGSSPDLFGNSSVPKLIQTDLYFGRNISGGGMVSEGDFQMFLDTVVTPFFPAGSTVFDAQGQFLGSSGTLIKEASKLLTLILEDTLLNEGFVNEVIDTYLERFNQESVLAVFDPDVAVRFLETADIPEPSTLILTSFFLLLFLFGGVHKAVLTRRVYNAPRAEA
jgi:Protein of unknown function (DUF3574)